MFPGLDCGSCGAPTCRSLAEDIARGVAKETDCIHILMKRLHNEIGVLIGMAGKDFVIPGRPDEGAAPTDEKEEKE